MLLNTEISDVIKTGHIFKIEKCTEAVL